MRAPYKAKDLKSVQRLFDYLFSRVREQRGPYTISSGNLVGAGAASGPFTITHNLGHTNYYVTGEPLDAGFGYCVNWLVANKQKTSVDIYFRNNGGGTAALVLNAFLVV